MWVGILMIVGLFVFSNLISKLETALDPNYRAAKEVCALIDKMMEDGVNLSEFVKECPDTWDDMEEILRSSVKSEEYKGSGTFDRKSIGELEIEASRNLIAYRTALQSVDKNAYDKLFGGK